MKKQLVRNGLARRTRRRDFLDKRFASTARQFDEFRLPSVDNLMNSSMDNRKSRLSHAYSAEELGGKDTKDFKSIVEEFKKKYRV